MAGRKPDYDVAIAVEYEAQGEKRTRWHNVGAAWKGENGFVSFNMVTNPGVKFVLCPPKEKKDGDETGAVD